MATLNDLIRNAAELTPQLISLWGIHPELAIRFAIAAELVEDAGLESPEIISGMRSREKQLRLFKDWEAGRLQNRPATQSWHFIDDQGFARAIDVTPSLGVGFELFALIMEFFGVRWGGRFSTPDRPHFDLPGPERPDPLLFV